MSFLYSAECEACGRVINYSSIMDDDDDISISVTPCEFCTNKLLNKIADLKKQEDEAASLLTRLLHSSDEAASLKEKIVELESELESERS